MSHPRDAWAARADDLARWVLGRYVVREDVWGGYVAAAERDVERTRADGTTYKLGATCTRPRKRDRGLAKLTPAVIAQHFRAVAAENVIGVHTTCPQNLCKYGTVEIDHHGEGSSPREATRRAALGWYEALRARGFHPLLWDSNGDGGYHLDVLFRELIPSARLFYYLRNLVRNYSEFGLTARPETFPKQPCLHPTPDGRGQYGNWCRLPGRHHTREHWARVWDGSAWLDGDKAIDFMLSLTGDPPSLVPEGVDLLVRGRAYLSKLPNRGEGQGRDDVAYQGAAFLVRDLALSDGVALDLLGEWDAGNRPRRAGTASARSSATSTPTG
jgi:hypothetical protein